MGFAWNLFGISILCPWLFEWRLSRSNLTLGDLGDDKPYVTFLMLRIWKSSLFDFVLVDFVNLLYLKIIPRNDLLLGRRDSNWQHQFLAWIHYKISWLLNSETSKMLNYPLLRLSESGSWVNLLSMIPNRDCHWNLSSQADSSSSLLAHIWFYPIDCHNLLWFFKWSCDRELIAKEK